MDTLTLDINGMSCGHCIARVKQTLAATPGVRVEDVTIGAAGVSYDSSLTTPDAIASAVTNAGYTAQVRKVGAARQP